MQMLSSKKKQMIYKLKRCFLSTHSVFFFRTPCIVYTSTITEISCNFKFFFIFSFECYCSLSLWRKKNLVNLAQLTQI